jgi:hypothetical protein
VGNVLDYAAGDAARILHGIGQRCPEAPLAGGIQIRHVGALPCGRAGLPARQAAP